MTYRNFRSLSFISWVYIFFLHAIDTLVYIHAYYTTAYRYMDTFYQTNISIILSPITVFPKNVLTSPLTHNWDAPNLTHCPTISAQILLSFSHRYFHFKNSFFSLYSKCNYIFSVQSFTNQIDFVQQISQFCKHLVPYMLYLIHCFSISL